MEKFSIHTGLVVPLDRENVDTDAIIPAALLAGGELPINIRRVRGPKVFLLPGPDAPRRHQDPGTAQCM